MRNVRHFMTLRHARTDVSVRSLLCTLTAMAIFTASVIVTMSVIVAIPAMAQDIDPHQLYEQRCAACHPPHARELVKDTLTMRQGNLILKSDGTGFIDFLASHPRRPLDKPQAEALTKQFEAMLKTGFLFEQKCIVCHERAIDLARLNLLERDGTIIARYTGRDIATFLQTHGRLTPREVDTIIAMLHRQLSQSSAD